MSQANKQSGGSFLPTEYVKGRSQLRANIMALLLFVLLLLIPAIMRDRVAGSTTSGIIDSE